MTICIDPKSEILDRKNGRQKLFVHEGKGVGVDLGSWLANEACLLGHFFSAVFRS